MRDAIAAMREAFTQLARGRVELPLRTAIRTPAREGVTLVMPGRCDLPLGLGAKIVSVFPRNAEQSLPAVHAAVLLLDAATGAPVALLEGGALTALRTGAASGLASDLLARADATRVAVIGSGVQARTQLEAVCAVRPVASAAVYSRTAAHAERFAAEMAQVAGVPANIDVVSSPRRAVRGADIVCLATASTTPLIEAEDVEAGTHVNAVGSFTPEMREFAPALLGHALLMVDQRAAALAEAGEVIAGVREGFIAEHELHELGAVLLGAAPLRESAEQITVFKSVGLAVQDLVAAASAVVRARAAGRGVTVAL